MNLWDPSPFQTVLQSSGLTPRWTQLDSPQRNGQEERQDCGNPMAPGGEVRMKMRDSPRGEDHLEQELGLLSCPLGDAIIQMSPCAEVGEQEVRFQRKQKNALGSRRHICHKCGKSFAQSSGLTKHRTPTSVRTVGKPSSGALPCHSSAHPHR